MHDYKDFIIKRFDKTNLWTNPCGSVLNPGMIELDGKTYFAYRTGYTCHIPTSIIVGDLSADWILSNTHKVNFALNPKLYTYEDPRFFIYGGKLWMHLVVVCHEDRFIHWMKIGLVEYESMSLRILRTTGTDEILCKNWVPFEYNGQLYLTYSMFDGEHVIGKVDVDGIVTQAYKTQFTQEKWNNRRALRGTSNLVMKDGLLWGVAHTKHIPISGVLYYYAIFYAMNPEPPFKIVYLQKEPMIGTGTEWLELIENRKIYCIFPSGLMFKDDNWIIAAGINDYSSVIMKVPHKLVLNTIRYVSK